jgi:mannose-6-phosphate isomerase-like protein (cupin superfamily)
MLTVDRPWGFYETLLEGHHFLVKKIWIRPHQRISLQRHAQRSENWVVVEGSGTLTCGNTVIPAGPGTTLFVPENAVHRAEAGENGLCIIEVQRGAHLSEDDITRLQDDYKHLRNSF